MSMLNKLKYLGIAVPCFIASVAYANSVIDELEPNDSADSTQMLMAQGQATVPAFLGNGGAYDLDYYTFYAMAGAVVSVDIDNGYGDAQSVDTMIAIFDSTPAHSILRWNDDARTIDPGSLSTRDSRIDYFVAPTTGFYVVGVSNYPRYFVNGGGVANNFAHHGDYTLIVNGVTSLIKHVAIVIKPGNDDIAPINPKSHGKIPVAILSGPDFDATTIVTKKLTFGSTGKEQSLSRCNKDGEDVNDDGLLDLVCHFNTQDAHFKKTDAEGTVHGWTVDGTEFEGTGYLKVVPEKRTGD